MRLLFASLLLASTAIAGEAPSASLLSPVPAFHLASDNIKLEAKPGEGAMVIVGDDAFRFRIRGRAQVRTEFERENDDTAVGFQVRRLRLTLNGDMLKKQFGWNVQLAFAPRDIEKETPSIVRDAFLIWNIAPEFKLRLGTMKVPFDRQRVTSSSSLQFAERSDVVNELTLDRDNGLVAFGTAADVFTYEAGVFGGDGRNKLNGDTGVMGVARVRYAPLGKFEDDQIEGDIIDGPARISVGAALAYNAQSPRQRSTIGSIIEDGSIDYAHATLDVLVKCHGFSLLAAGLARAATATTVVDGRARSAVGGFVQAGLMVQPGIEFVGRAGHIEPIRISVANDDDLTRSEELRMGVNLYALGHEAKISTDVGLRMTDAITADGHVMVQLTF
jgi:phosphate-selective porin OprO and OprP